MTPELLGQYLDVLRAKGVQNADVQFPGSDASAVRIYVTFEMPMGPLPGEAPTPGGWKSPARLDHPDQFAADFVPPDAP